MLTITSTTNKTSSEFFDEMLLTAEQDIECYKVLETVPTGLTCEGYLTPHVHWAVPENVAAGDAPLFASLQDEEFKYKTLHNCGIMWRTKKSLNVGEGLIHVFPTLEQAMEILKKSSSNVLFRVVIPAGARYMVDSTGNHYGARKILFKERLAI